MKHLHLFFLFGALLCASCIKEEWGVIPNHQENSEQAKEWNKNKSDWIVSENENWSGNYIVKYWKPEWKEIIKEYQKKLDKIGVDGYLLDTLDSYSYFEK